MMSQSYCYACFATLDAQDSDPALRRCVICPHCQAAYHEQCWQASGHCQRCQHPQAHWLENIPVAALPIAGRRSPLPTHPVYRIWAGEWYERPEIQKFMGVALLLAFCMAMTLFLMVQFLGWQAQRAASATATRRAAQTSSWVQTETARPTLTPTQTPTYTPTLTPSLTPTKTLTPTQTPTFTITWTPTITSTPTKTSRATKSPTPTKTSTGPISWRACEGAPFLSRLQVGDRAYVSYDPPLSNNVRKMPYRDSEVIGKIKPGEKVKIIKGPSCSGGQIWWKVTSEKTGLTGWTGEGSATEYWLIPER